VIYGVTIKMDLRNFARIWRERRILTAVMLGLAVAAVLAALATVPRTYQSTASVIMLAPRSAARLTGGNPYLSFSPSLTLTASAVADEVMAPQVARKLTARGLDAAYTVALAPYTTNTTGSVLLVAVTGTSKAATQSTLAAVNTQISAALASLQHGVAARGRIRAATLSYSPQPALSVSKTARSLIMVVVPVVLAALSIPLLTDAAARRLGRRRGIRAGHALGPAEREVGASAPARSAAT
jgi:hypothetical protein